MLKPLILLTISTTFLSACSILSSNNIAPGYRAAYEGISSYFFPKDDESITPRIINNIPYASALISLGGSSRSLIILESINNKTYHYVSSDSIYISIEEGRIVNTSGLSNNLTELKVPFLLSELHDNTETLDYFTYYSYDIPQLVGLKIKATIEYAGTEEVDLYTSKKVLRRFEESISNDYLGWKRKNIFWLDEEGYVWKSTQYISPKLPSFTFVITKKPA